MCNAVKKLAKERALDMEATAEKMIFLKKRQVYRWKSI